MSHRARSAPAIALAFAFVPATVFAGDPAPLDAYRAFARAPEAHALLAGARASMLAHFDGAPPGSAHAGDVAWPGTPTAVYVSLADGKLTRACIGSATPGATLGAMVRDLAVQALNADRRRAPVRREELDGLRVIVSFAGAGTPVADPMSVALAREGLLIRTARGSVAFLPGEARTIAYALREARRIGVLGDAREAAFERFPVVAISESPAPRAVKRTEDP